MRSRNKKEIFIRPTEKAIRFYRKNSADNVSKEFLPFFEKLERFSDEEIAAFTEARDWLDLAIAQIQANQRLFQALLRERVPAVTYTPGSAGYLAWLDLRGTGLGEAPAERLLQEARIGLNDGKHFGAGGQGFARLNLACAPDTLVQGVDRIASLVAKAAAQTGDQA